jgi:Protein of unknown function (DUF2867)
LPGEALLEFRIEPRGAHQCTLRQIALFRPRGLFGLLYWYAVAPFHHLVFRGMLLGIEREALQLAARNAEVASAPGRARHKDLGANGGSLDRPL